MRLQVPLRCWLSLLGFQSISYANCSTVVGLSIWLSSAKSSQWTCEQLGSEGICWWVHFWVPLCVCSVGGVPRRMKFLLCFSFFRNWLQDTDRISYGGVDFDPLWGSDQQSIPWCRLTLNLSQSVLIFANLGIPLLHIIFSLGIRNTMADLKRSDHCFLFWHGYNWFLLLQKSQLSVANRTRGNGFW